MGKSECKIRIKDQLFIVKMKIFIEPQNLLIICIVNIWIIKSVIPILEVNKYYNMVRISTIIA